MAANTSLQGRNRTSVPGNTDLSGDLFDFGTITTAGVTPAQAAALAAPIEQLLAMLPYELNDKGVLDYRKSAIAMTHAPELTYAADHPDPALAGQPIDQGLYKGAYIAQYGGAPMPHLDLDGVSPLALQAIMKALIAVRDTVATAT